MPKIVDHAARREELAVAVWRLISSSGVNAATVRAVAAESGWSMGAVRYYFASQDELLLFACEVMAQRVGERVRRLYADADVAPGVERALTVLEQMLPLDEERRVEVLVWFAFMALARTDARFDELRTAGWTGSRYLCRLALADALGLEFPQQLGDPLPTPELEAAALRLHVHIDGMSVQAGTYPEHWSAEQLVTQLHRLFDDELVRPRPAVG